MGTRQKSNFISTASEAQDRLLREAVREHKRVFQFGTQQRSGREFHQACELVRNGRIGKLKQINAWAPASRPGGSTTPAPVALNEFREWKERYGTLTNHGTAFEGTEGWVLVSRGSLRTSPEGLAEEPIDPKPNPLVKSSNPVRNFLEGVRTRGATICPVDEAVKADTLCHLSDIATRLEPDNGCRHGSGAGKPFTRASSRLNPGVTACWP